MTRQMKGVVVFNVSNSYITQQYFFFIYLPSVKKQETEAHPDYDNEAKNTKHKLTGAQQNKA